MTTVEVRRCGTCREEKRLNEFFKDRTKKHGHTHKCKECTKSYVKQWRADNSMHVREKELKKRFGISLFDYEKMLFAQGGGCAICGSSESRNTRNKFLCVDHCHLTGTVRSLLCQPCNVGIGNFKERADLLLRAAAYLRRHAPEKVAKPS